jgi:subtilisin family serine protease
MKLNGIIKKTGRKTNLAGSVFVLFFAAISQNSFANVSNLSQEFRPGEIIVKFKSDAAFSQFNADSFTTMGFQIQSITPVMADESIQKIKLDANADVLKAVQALNKNAAIEIAEPNYIYTTAQVNSLADPTDEKFAEQWSLSNIGQKDARGVSGIPKADINVLPLWNEGKQGAAEVVVAVVDTGVEWSHPDLIDNLYTNRGEIPDNGIDDDANGFIDDVHGWNAAAMNKNSNDDNGHGTHVAGIIGAKSNNNIGVSGINWKVSLLPVKFLDAGGRGSLDGAVRALDYARKMKVQIMNNSWGGSFSSAILQDAVKRTLDDGILFVAAAGNDGTNNDTRKFYPCSYPFDNVISVAATDNQDNLAIWPGRTTGSNYGASTVHVGAPGLAILSTYTRGTYKALSGTSMASPHVAGVAALVAASGVTGYKALKQRILDNSDKLSSLMGKTTTGGRINAFKAVNAL